MEQSWQNFPETADIETSSAAYAQRFDGELGRWLLSVQEKAALELLNRVKPANVLELGGGHAQLTATLLQNCRQLTVLGSAPQCQERLQPYLQHPEFRFEVENLIDLPYQPQSFDLLISLRFISHCQNWPKLITEMCRVARRAVIVDYARLFSFNLLYSSLFALKRRAEGNTREFLIFKDSQINQHFLQHGFKLQARVGQFFFPMVLHRVLSNKTFSRAIECPAQLLGLSALCGSPVLALYQRL